ncbi:hypothetical protein H0H81_009428 [Sphagnurus paluster]|uniref:Ribosomal protein/NADH dehydrogenase domain-containing protein n=1 Tax=Sphagnurus paluster TaxID=117069 RepID=A0A9P7K5N9_9AGAR|nr:hypothetical protein H0H81_009428 [Sphagnurus paluster]
MSRLAKRAAAGPSHLARVLANLNAAPKLTLSGLKSLKLSLAFQNDHFGARHFVKEQLPRIRYANPQLEIEVEKVRKTAEEAWRPEMELEFTNGTRTTLDMHAKWSSTITKELMDLAGGDAWAQWKAHAAAAGVPLVPGSSESPTASIPAQKGQTQTQLPTLKAFRAAREREAQAAAAREVRPEEVVTPTPKTGAAAVLP